MSKLDDINAAIAAKKQEAQLAEIDAEIAKRQPQQNSDYFGSSIIEPAAAIGSSFAGSVVSGVDTLGKIIQGENPQEIERNQNAIRESMTFQPRTPSGQEGLQSVADLLSPVSEFMQRRSKETGDIGFKAGGDEFGEFGAGLGAAMSTIPDAILELVGFGAVKRAAGAGKTDANIRARNDRDTINNAEINRVKNAPTNPVDPDAASQVFNIKNAAVEPEAQSFRQVLDNLKRKKTAKSVLDVMPDEEILRSAKQLGIDLNPDHYSNNQVFIESIQSLKSRPESTIGATETRIIQQLGEKAEELVNKLGGGTDKSLFDLSIKEDFTGVIESLSKQAGVAYKAVEDVIPESIKVEANSSKQYITSTLETLGDDATQLTPVETKLLSILENNPTYTALDRIRKDVGKGFNKQGVYADTESSILKQVYKVLSEDQQGVADAFGVGAEYAAGRKLVSSRKAVEDGSVRLFGRQMNDSIVPKITASATALTKGDVSKFVKLMDSLPEGRRSEAAATMLTDIFTHGARVRGGGVGQGFVKAFEGLNRNKAAKDRLFQYLPEGAEETFNNIGNVAKGLYRSKSLENTSKTARDVINAMDSGGMFKNVLGVGGQVAAAEGVSVAAGLPMGIGAGGVVISALSRTKTAATVKAEKFLTSAKFKNAVETAARKNDPLAADKILNGSSKYEAWKGLLTPEEATLLATQGFIHFVSRGGEQIEQKDPLDFNIDLNVSERGSGRKAKVKLNAGKAKKDIQSQIKGLRTLRGQLDANE